MENYHKEFTYTLNDKPIIISLDVLRVKKIYSPMFDNTFNVMSDEECQKQLDKWVNIPAKIECVKKLENFEPLEDRKQRKENFRKFIGGSVDEKICNVGR